MEVAPGAKQDESALQQHLRALEHRRAGAAVELRDGRALGRADRDQPRRPAAGGDGVVQPRAGHGARRRHGEDREVPRADPPAVLDHHELRRRRGGVQELAGQPGGPDRLGAARDLRAARRALRKLHPPADDPGRPAVGRGRRAADAQALRPGPDADRDHRHPAADRHRQEERDHDDRLRARRAAHAGHGAARRRSARPACCASGRS